MAVEKPMCGRRQGQTVLDDIGAAVSHGPDMRSLGLGTPPTINDAEPRDCASVLVSLEDVIPEIRVTDLPINEYLLDPSVSPRSPQEFFRFGIEVLSI